MLDEDPTPGNGIVIDAETVENRAGNPHHHIRLKHIKKNFLNYQMQEKLV